MTPEVVWDLVKDEIAYDPDAFLIFDDSVLDKNHSHQIELVKKQYSGNAHRLIKGIGVVNCLYVNPKTGQYWIIDWRIYAPESDQKTKLQHVAEMLDSAVLVKQIPFWAVLMDSWYATKKLMLHIHRAHKIFYCPVAKNRCADESDGKEEYKAVSQLQWDHQTQQCGKLLKLKEFPGGLKVKLFRVVVSNNRTDWVVTNDIDQASTENTHKICQIRWKIEQYHREVKQALGIEKCQCRSGRAQRNHIGCVILAWHSLTAFAKRLNTNIYRIKSAMLSHYLKQELISPTVLMTHC
jgi:hypothetical protein